ncbi:MAG TPA: ferredoxin [Firmicutes bacterium]|jgi:nitroreductase/NAD-dependent dihydropyrimidine dehydrogenase PreA subunit|nr:ferredoxin [Bacillota bacterium]
MIDDNFIQVNKETCKRCGQCVNVCRGTLVMGNSGPEIAQNLCIECGHCVAVCPSGALNNTRTPLKNQVPIKKELSISSEIAAAFLRSRRSIRSFNSKAVEREIINKLLDIARFAPTACNSQGISYHVIDKKETLRSISSVIADWAEGNIKSGPLKNSPWVNNTANTIYQYRNSGKDTILRDAPCLIISTVKTEQFSLGRDNTHFSFSYVQLYAPTLGLGSCWSGLFEYCALDKYEPLLSLLEIPKNRVITGGLLVGYPVYHFKRLVDREPLQVTWQ